MKSRLNPFAILMLIALTLNFVSCSSAKKKEMSDTQDTQTEAPEEVSSSNPFELNGDSDSGKAGQLQSVYFAFNSATLSSETRKALDSNAEFLKSNISVQVQVEGHCDERGGVQYNLALGEKRAMATKNYLVTMGIASNRVSTVTYGKERPVAFGHDESSWSQNRRSNFVITAK